MSNATTPAHARHRTVRTTAGHLLGSAHGHLRVRRRQDRETTFPDRSPAPEPRFVERRRQKRVFRRGRAHRTAPAGEARTGRSPGSRVAASGRPSQRHGRQWHELAQRSPLTVAGAAAASGKIPHRVPFSSPSPANRWSGVCIVPLLRVASYRMMQPRSGGRYVKRADPRILPARSVEAASRKPHDRIDCAVSRHSRNAP